MSRDGASVMVMVNPKVKVSKLNDRALEIDHTHAMQLTDLCTVTQFKCHI